MPPCRCPSASTGFSTFPASSTVTWRIRVAFPVWVSTSTTARCAPNGNVGLAGRKSTSADRPAGPALPGPAGGVQLQVGGAGLDHACGHVPGLVLHLDRGLMDRGPA